MAFFEGAPRKDFHQRNMQGGSYNEYAPNKQMKFFEDQEKNADARRARIDEIERQLEGMKAQNKNIENPFYDNTFRNNRQVGKNKNESLAKLPEGNGLARYPNQSLNQIPTLNNMESRRDNYQNDESDIYKSYQKRPQENNRYQEERIPEYEEKKQVIEYPREEPQYFPPSPKYRKKPSMDQQDRTFFDGVGQNNVQKDIRRQYQDYVRQEMELERQKKSPKRKDVIEDSPYRNRVSNIKRNDDDGGNMRGGGGNFGVGILPTLQEKKMNKQQSYAEILAQQIQEKKALQEQKKRQEALEDERRNIESKIPPIRGTVAATYENGPVVGKSRLAAIGNQVVIGDISSPKNDMTYMTKHQSVKNLPKYIPPNNQPVMKSLDVNTFKNREPMGIDETLNFEQDREDFNNYDSINSRLPDERYDTNVSEVPKYNSNNNNIGGYKKNDTSEVRRQYQENPGFGITEIEARQALENDRRNRQKEEIYRFHQEQMEIKKKQREEERMRQVMEERRLEEKLLRDQQELQRKYQEEIRHGNDKIRSLNLRNKNPDQNLSSDNPFNQPGNNPISNPISNQESQFNNQIVQSSSRKQSFNENPIPINNNSGFQQLPSQITPIIKDDTSQHNNSRNNLENLVNRSVSHSHSERGQEDNRSVQGSNKGRDLERIDEAIFEETDRDQKVYRAIQEMNSNRIKNNNRILPDEVDEQDEKIERTLEETKRLQMAMEAEAKRLKEEVDNRSNQMNDQLRKLKTEAFVADEGRINAQKELLRLKEELRTQRLIEDYKNKELEKYLQQGTPAPTQSLHKPYPTIYAAHSNFDPEPKLKPRVYAKFSTLDEENQYKKNFTKMEFETHLIPLTSDEQVKGVGIFKEPNSAFEKMLKKYGINDKLKDIEKEKDYAFQQFNVYFPEHKVDNEKLGPMVQPRLNDSGAGDEADDPQSIDKLDKLLGNYKNRDLHRGNETDEDYEGDRLVVQQPEEDYDTNLISPKSIPQNVGQNYGVIHDKLDNHDLPINQGHPQNDELVDYVHHDTVGSQGENLNDLLTEKLNPKSIS